MKATIPAEVAANSLGKLIERPVTTPSTAAKRTCAELEPAQGRL